MAMKNDTKRPFSILSLCLFAACAPLAGVASEVAQVSGTVAITVSAGTVASPSYKVASAGISGDPVYSGAVASVSGNVLTFETTTDTDGNTVNPFTPNALASGVAHLKAAISGGAVTGITDEEGNPLSGTNTESSGLDNSNPPTITIDEPDSGDDAATATATVSGGKITGISVTSGGSGYTTVPTVTVNCGPHFVRLTESGSDKIGRNFLITANDATTITVSNPDNETLSNIFATDYTVEIVRGNTLGELFGADTPSIATGNPYTADFLYLWSLSRGFYVPYFHFAGQGSFVKGWYDRTNPFGGVKNDTVIYPDEAFILARRTNSALNLSFDGGVVSTDQQMQLPASGKQYVMNNPFGADILMTELINPEDIGTGNSQFKPGTTANDGADGDNVYLLQGSAWSKYWYESGVNDGVTTVATVAAKAGSGGGGAMTSSDVSLASGTVSGLATCDSSGGTAGVDHNESEYVKVSISGTAPAAGFTITFSDMRGRKLNDNGDMEEDIDGNEVTAGNGIKILSGLIGSHEVSASGSGYVVIKKRRDVNFDATGATPTWSTGSGGAGYSANAKAYFIGGGGSGAEGTATVSGGAVTGITITSGGSGYTSAPQVVIGGGGWRKEGAAGASQDGTTIEAGSGILIVRNHSTGVLTYLQAKNPLN